MNGTTIQQVVEQSAPKENTLPPYPSWGSAASARQPNTAPSDVRADPLRPTVEPPAPTDIERTIRDGASTANAAGIATSVTETLIQMLLIGLLALGAAGLLYRLVTAAARRRQIIVDHPKFDLVHHQNPHNDHDSQQRGLVNRREGFIKDLHRSPLSVANDRDNQKQNADDELLNNGRRTNGASQFTNEANEHNDTMVQLGRELVRSQRQVGDDEQQYKSIEERDQLVDDLHRSPISGASDYELYAPHPANDLCANSVRGTGGASQVPNEVREREERFAQLKRDLDWLLQLPKRA